MESDLIKQRASETCTRLKAGKLYEVMGLDSSNYLDTGDKFSNNSTCNLIMYMLSFYLISLSENLNGISHIFVKTVRFTMDK